MGSWAPLASSDSVDAPEWPAARAPGFVGAAAGALVAPEPPGAPATTPRRAPLFDAPPPAGTLTAGQLARAREVEARRALRPLPDEPARGVGEVITSPLTARELAPVAGGWTGPPLVVHDNPETFSTPGVLGSTIAPVPGRGDGQLDLPGAAHLFTLAHNGTGGPQRFSTVVHNTSDRPLTLTVSGTVYSKKVTPTDGTIPGDYRADGGFRGPHAIAARSYLAAQPGKNGYGVRTVTLAPGETRAVASTGVHPGGEVFSMLDLRAGEPGQTFRVASVASPRELSAEDLRRIGAGNYPAAGAAGDFAAAGTDRLGRPNGVVEDGSVFEGGRTVRLEAGTRTGDLFYATKFKNAGSRDEIGVLSRVLPNPAGVGSAATTGDGNYGAVHRLHYVLDNPGDAPRRVEVALTAPSSGEGAHRPLGGELTLPVKVNGQIVNARVNGRGEGRVIAVLEVPPHSQRDLELELAHFGNTFPPAGVELRTR